MEVGAGEVTLVVTLVPQEKNLLVRKLETREIILQHRNLSQLPLEVKEVQEEVVGVAEGQEEGAGLVQLHQLVLYQSPKIISQKIIILVTQW